jgi:hypothetical protein
VQPFDGVVERPQLVTGASRNIQRVNGLGPVSAQGDRVGGVLDQPKLDRVGDGPSPHGSFGARLVRRLHPQALRYERRRLLVERVLLAGDLEHDVHSAEPISALRRMEEIIARHSGQPLEKVSKDMERDYFMTAAEAMEYGLIDKVLARRFESDARPAV